MEPLRLDPVPARVLAWHNRHPLARRIAPEHIGSMGYVALPFVQRPGKSGLRRGFDEDFLDGAPLGALGRWAARHGAPSPEPPDDGPLREVKKSGERFEPGDTAVTLYVRTAFIDDGTLAGRVLVGAGHPAPVFGARLISRPRKLALGGLLAAGAIAAVVLLWPAAAPEPVVATLAAPAGAASAASSPAIAASAASSPAIAAPASVASAAAPAATASAAESHPHEAAAVASHAEPAASAPAAADSGPPLDVQPRWGRIDMPSIKPSLHGVEPPVTRPPPAAPPTDGPVWALATRSLRSEADSEQAAVAIGALLQRAGLRAQRVQVLEMGGSRHVVVYPFANRSAADNARHMLAGRGFATEPVEF